MNGRRLTDVEISQALRAHLPDRAYPGLRERILDAAATTRQQRALPSVAWALSEADPAVRRQSILVAAALLVALALAGVAAVGALRQLQHDPIQDLSLEPPTDLQAFVLSSHDRSCPAAARRHHDARQRRDQGPHLRRSVGRRPPRAVRVGRCDRARHVHDPQRHPLRSDGGGRAEHGVGRGGRRHRRGPAGLHPLLPHRPVLRRRVGLRDDPGSERGRQRDGGDRLAIRRRRLRGRAPCPPSRLCRRRGLDRR